jgi:hypothetical protein
MSIHIKVPLGGATTLLMVNRRSRANAAAGLLDIKHQRALQRQVEQAMAQSTARLTDRLTHARQVGARVSARR